MLCFPFIGISLTFPRGDAAFITPPGLSSSKPLTKGNWVLHSLWKNCHTGIIRSILPDDEVSLSITFFSYWLSCIGGEDGKIQMWKDSPLDSSGFKDVDGDVEMMIAPKAYPLSSKNRKRNHDEDEILVRVLIDSITYVSQVDVRQERNCDTNDISISGTQKFVCCQICLVELDNSDTKQMYWRFCLASRKRYDPKV